MWKTELKFGICGGIAICLFKCIEYLYVVQTIRLETGMYTGLLAVLIVVAVIVLGVKVEQNEAEDYSFTFRKAFRTGMIIAILMAIIASPFTYAYRKYINPKEANQMVEYIKNNRSPDAVPLTKEEIQGVSDYYKPSRRALHTAAVIILTGFFVSLFSAGMFRHTDRSELDADEKEKLPSIVMKLFLLGLTLISLPILVYLCLFLKYDNISTKPFDFIVEPINEGVLQAATALFALGALVINILVYSKLSFYSHRVKVKKMWSVLMIIICGAIFFVSLWPVL